MYAKNLWILENYSSLLIYPATTISFAYIMIRKLYVMSNDECFVLFYFSQLKIASYLAYLSVN